MGASLLVRMDGRPYEGLRLAGGGRDSRHIPVRMDGRPYEGLRQDELTVSHVISYVRMDGRPYEGLRQFAALVNEHTRALSEWTADPMRD